MNRKGFSESVLKGMVLALIIFVILLLLYHTIFDFTSAYVSHMECKESVKAAAALRFKGTSLMDNVKCPTTYERITSSKPDEIKMELAKYMFMCGSTFYDEEGKIMDIFMNEDERFCVICYEIDFSHEGVELTDMGRFFMETNIPKKLNPGSEPVTFGSYFLPPGTEERDIYFPPTSDQLTTDHPLGIVFILDKDAHLSLLRRFATFAGIGGGTAAAALVVGRVVTQAPVPLPVSAFIFGSALAAGAASIPSYEDADLWATIVAWPYSEIGQLNCTYMPSEQS